MKPHMDAGPSSKKLLALEPVNPGHQMLSCLPGTNEPNIERAIIERVLSSNYHPSFQHELTHALEEALGWISVQCLLGASPYNHDLMMLMQRDKKSS